MIRQGVSRLEPGRKKKPLAGGQDQIPASYPYRLNFYTNPPTGDISLENFEQWAIDRLHVLADLELCSFRNRTGPETAAHMKPVLERCLPLDSNTAGSRQDRVAGQRRKDHCSHFILRLAFAGTEDLRRRFVRAEAALFRLRWEEAAAERVAFVAGLGLDWCETVSAEERDSLRDELAAVLTSTAAGGAKRFEEETWFKVDWRRVPELVEGRRALLRAGKAYVPARDQASMVFAEFSSRLERQLEITAKAIHRLDLDEDERLRPILDHLAKNLHTPGGGGGIYASGGIDAAISARSIDGLAERGHFPACAWHLHQTLRRDARLKHFGRLQYGLFLKGIGLSLEESLVFWRTGFHKITDDEFNKEYRYNVRHLYGDVGGDSNRRGGGYSPFGCQKILMEHPPGPGESHGCPYRHFSPENLRSLVQDMGISERAVLEGVREDREGQRYHLACNRVFEHLHKAEIKRAKDERILTAAQLDTIAHPNEYFKRSYLLKNLDHNPAAGDGDVKMGG